MLRARIRPGRGADCWRRFFASSSIGGGEKGSLAANLNNNTAGDDLARRRALTLSLWRDYLCLLERLGPEDAEKRKASAAAEIRSWGEEQKKGQQKSDDGDEEKQPPLDPDAGVKRLMAAVSFLRATTRRSAEDRRRLSSSGEGVFVVREGELVRVEGGGERGGGEPSRSTQAGKLSPDEAFRKHRELMRRQFYGREPPRGAPGRF